MILSLLDLEKSIRFHLIVLVDKRVAGLLTVKFHGFLQSFLSCYDCNVNSSDKLINVMSPYFTSIDSERRQ